MRTSPTPRTRCKGPLSRFEGGDLGMNFQQLICCMELVIPRHGAVWQSERGWSRGLPEVSHRDTTHLSLREPAGVAVSLAF